MHMQVGVDTYRFMNINFNWCKLVLTLKVPQSYSFRRWGIYKFRWQFCCRKCISKRISEYFFCSSGFLGFAEVYKNINNNWQLVGSTVCGETNGSRLISMSNDANKIIFGEYSYIVGQQQR